VTLWLDQWNFSYVSKICRTYNLSQELVVNHLLAWTRTTTGRLPVAYWHDLQQVQEDRKRP